MKRKHWTCSLILLASMFAVQSPGFAQTGTCDENSVVASAIRTRADVQAFVQCAYELVREMGTDAARMAFHEEGRWRSGAYYVFVDEVTPMRDAAQALVFPPDPSREGTPWGRFIDAYGNDYFQELHRIMGIVDEGWLYYSITNPATGNDDPKASYVKAIDWDGTPAAIGAGIYLRDLPGTCQTDEVNAMGLANDPSDRRLQEFVRCAAMEMERMGYFASIGLSSDPRWRRESIYVFGVDMNGNTLFSGDAYRWGGWTLGGTDSELTSLSDRDDLSVANAFGETFLYYMSRNPSTGLQQRKVVFVKRVVTYGLPILIGSGYYLPDEE